MNAIEVRNIKKSFGNTKALDEISFNISEGDIYGLVGPDGAGKTTLMRILVGIMSADSGEALVGGYDIFKQSDNIKQLTGYMSQKFSLYGDLSVSENMEFYADLYQIPQHERQKRIKRLLQFSRLGPFLSRRADALSGGMKQKLGLSCALIHTPKILILDEPTTGVDPVSRRELWMILYELWKEGMTILVSTPYMDEAERCSRVGFIYHGKIIAEDTPDVLKEKTDFSVIQIQLKDITSARGKFEKIDRIRGYNIFGNKLHIPTVNYKEDNANIKKLLNEFNIAIESITEVKPSLEDIFLNLTSQDNNRSLS